MCRTMIPCVRTTTKTASLQHNHPTCRLRSRHPCHQGSRVAAAIANTGQNPQPVGMQGVDRGRVREQHGIVSRTWPRSIGGWGGASVALPRRSEPAAAATCLVAMMKRSTCRWRSKPSMKHQGENRRGSSEATAEGAIINVNIWMCNDTYRISCRFARRNDHTFAY